MKIHNTLRQQVNRRLIKVGFDGNRMFRKPGSAWGELFQTLLEFGLTSDDLPQFRGDSGFRRMTYRYEGEAYEGSEIGNSLISFTWHKMPSGLYEVIAYLS